MRGSILESEPKFPARAIDGLRVLLVDGSSHRAAVVARLGGDERFGLVEAATDLDVDRLLAADAIDVVVSELADDHDKLSILERCRRSGSQASVVILTSRGDEYWAAEAIKRGAADYLAKKPGYLDRLTNSLLAATERKRAGSNGHAAPTTDDIRGYCRILNALPVHLAMLDEQGRIVAVNDAWRQYPVENQYQSGQHVVGIDYVAVCEAAAAAGHEAAEAISDGLSRVLGGRCSTFAVEYPFMSEGTQRWFKMAASPLRDDKHRGAMIAHVDITDRKHAELERDQIFEQSLSLLCIGGFDGYMRRWSRSVHVLGYEPDELAKIPLWSLLHPDDRELALAMGAQLRAGEMVTTTELRVRSKDGGYRWILWDAVPCLEQGLFFATGQDITDRKEIEQQLRESHQRFQLLAGATREAIWDWDLRENRLWQNEAYLEVFGTFDQSKETAVEWWRRRVHPDDRDRVLGLVPPEITGARQQWVLEYRLQRADGSYAYVYDRGFVIFDEQQKPVRMVGSIIDVTALKTTEQKLRESDERFRLAARATRDAIWDWDRKRDYVWRSKGFQSLFGYAADQITPDLDWWIERIHPDDREAILAQLPAMESSSSQQCIYEYRFRRADGSYADVIDRGFVMLDESGKPARLVGSIMDVSERRRAEQLAHMHQAELAHRSRISTMGEIATGIAHELNQPLTAISNYAESCTRAITAGGENDAKLLNWIGKIANNTHRAAEMIRRLRSFTRKGEPTRDMLEARELVAETIDLLEAETRLQSVRLKWKPPKGSLPLRVDRIQIEQVLVNLLRNAYEAMAGNQAEDRSVTIAVARQADKIEVSVRDVGEGIDAENLERVFDAFYTSKPSGVGIGLAISRSIIEDHGGRLWVEANPDRGVTFRFTVPLSGAAE